ncbi:MAG TPA: M42 family metallopeptidase [Anaerolineae bacterium]|nr:M42 family metallopeptidase [Anaerolineae bacterium]
MKELIKQLTEAYGPSGHEEQVRDIIRNAVEPHANSVRVDALGNLIAAKAGRKGGKKIMLAAHMDEIGVIVSYVDEKGFLRFQGIGGLDLMSLTGSRVQFADGVLGVIHPEDRQSYKSEPLLSKLYIDIGAASREEAQSRLGQAACFVRPFAGQGQRLVAKALDDRIGCAILVAALQQLDDTPHEVSFVFSVQEEVGLRGARTSAFHIAPEIGIALDVTLAADTPECRKLSMKLGDGPCIKVADPGLIAHPGVKDLLVRTAEAHGIPYQLEVLDGGTTDASAMQISGSGVAAGCVSIACRYVHTPSEMVDLRDVENAVRLLVAMLKNRVEL